MGFHTPPLSFGVSQRVLKILHSFLVQNASIFYGESIFTEISGARALPRALRAKKHWEFGQKLAQKVKNHDFHRF